MVSGLVPQSTQASEEMGRVEEGIVWWAWPQAGPGEWLDRRAVWAKPDSSVSIPSSASACVCHILDF